MERNLTHTCRVSRFLLTPLNHPFTSPLLDQEAKELLAPFQSPRVSTVRTLWGLASPHPTCLASYYCLSRACSVTPFSLALCFPARTRLRAMSRFHRNNGNVEVVDSDFLKRTWKFAPLQLGPPGNDLHWKPFFQYIFFISTNFISVYKSHPSGLKNGQLAPSVPVGQKNWTMHGIIPCTEDEWFII